MNRLLKSLIIASLTATAFCAVACNGPEEPEHTHAYTQEIVSETFLKEEATCTSKAIYYKSCECGEKGTETFEAGVKLAHLFDKEIIDAKYLNSEATCEAKATYYLSCECGEKGTETFETGDLADHVYEDGKCKWCEEEEQTPHTHVFDQEKVEEKYLDKEATCESKATYFKSCACGEKGSETFEVGIFADHVYEDGKCKWCEVEEPQGPHTHVFDQQKVEEKYLDKEATCEAKATYFKSCACGEKGSETFEVGELANHVYEDGKCKWCEVEEPHTHVFDQQKVEEKYLDKEATCEAKATYFKSCACGEKGTETFETGSLADHVYEDGKCKWCEVAEPQEPHTHVFDKEVVEAKYLDKEATCENKATYFKSCSCGEKGSDTFEVGELANHVYEDGKCKWCEVEEPHTHVFDQQKVEEKYLDKEATCENKATYFKSCSCGEKGSDTFEIGELADHVYEDGKCKWCEEDEPHTHVFDQEKVEAKYLDKEATCENKATYFKSCACGEKGSETFETGSLAGHVYDQEVVAPEYIASEATCSEKAYYYLTCKCGEIGDDIFEDEESDYEDHVFTTYVSDNNATCVADGTKTAYCDNGCGSFDTEIDEGTIVDHSFTNYVSNNDATFSKDGTKTASCDYDCGETDTIIDEGTKLVSVSIATPYAFDLKGGVDLTTLKNNEEEAISNVTAVYIDDVDYTSLLLDDKLTFTSDYYSVASEEAKTLTVFVGSTGYNFTGVTIWSLIVSNADELFEMSKYQYKSGVNYDGAFTFDADVNFADRDTTLNPAWDVTNKLGSSSTSSLSEGLFMGYIDGANHSLTSFNYNGKQGGLVSNAYGMTVKNLTIGVVSSGYTGVLGYYVSGVTLENVTVSGGISAFSGNGQVFNGFFGEKDIILKDVTVKCSYSNNAQAKNGRGIIAGIWSNTSSTNSVNLYSFTGKVIVDNLVVGSTFKVPIIGNNHQKAVNSERVLDFGSSVVVAEGAEKGVTFYNNTSLTGTAYEATATEVSVTLDVGKEFDFASLFGEGETFQYYKGALASGLSNFNKYAHASVSSGTSKITFANEGSFVFAVRTTNYKYYIVKITAEVHVCSFVNQEATEDYLVSVADCENPAIYKLSCKCGETDGSTFNFGEALGHDYGDFVSNGNGTHTKVCANDSKHVITAPCSGGTATEEAKAVCEYCLTEYGDVLPHVHVLDRYEANDLFLKKEATCDDPAIYYISCKCGGHGEQTFTSGEALGHEYGDFVSNGNGTHSRICANDDTHQITENCSGGTPTETNRPICSVCLGEYGSAIGHTHVYDQEVPEAIYLKSKATCQQVATYYKSCVCGDEGEETFAYGSLADHLYNQKVATSDYLQSPATCQSKPLYSYSCICGEEGSETFSFGITVDHDYSGNYTESKQATIFEEGLEVCQCSFGCGKTDERVIAKANLSSIKVTSNPYKTLYVEHEDFNSDGIVVVAIGDNESQVDITELVTFDKTRLFYQDHEVIVSYEDKATSVSIEVSELKKANTVSELQSTVEVGEFLPVKGLFVGVAQDGPNLNNEILIKDELTDDIIAVRGLPVGYGDFPSMNYVKGDEIRVWGTLAKGGTNTPNKRYVEFAIDYNPSVEDNTVISSGNEITYALDNVTTLSNWTDWKNYFTTANAQTYAYLKITGTIYYYRAPGITDGMYSRIHANSAAQHYTAIDTAAGYFMSIRDDIIEANIGSKWSNYFTSTSTSSTNYRRTIVVDEVICLLTGASDTDFQLTVLEESWFWGGIEEDDGTYTNGDVVAELINAYLRQAGQLEYDQYTKRRQLFATPEDATAQDLVYLDCSSYVSSVYYNSLGVEAIPSNYSQSTRYYAQYAREYNGNPDYPDVIGYWDTADYTTDAEKQAVIDYIKSVIQPGDILNYRHGNPKYFGTENYESNLKGHAILYVGDGVFSDSTGTSYNNSSGNLPYEKDPTTGKDRATKWEYLLGTVRTQDADIWFTSGDSRYLFHSSSSDMMYNISLIRPANRIGATPTEQAKARMTMRGVDFELLTSAGINSSVVKGGTITYSLTIKNTSTSIFKGLVFEDVMADGVTFVSSNAGFTTEGQKIKGTIDLGVRDTVTIEWTVKVGENMVAGTNFSNQTTLNGLKMKTISNSVSGYTTAQLNSISAKAREFAESGKTFTDPIEFIKAVYKDSINVELFANMSSADLFSSLFTHTTDTSATINTESAYYSMVAKNLYGGSDLHSTSYYLKNNLTRMVYEHNLTVGDVIVCEWFEQYRAYIYVGDGELVAIDSLTGTCELKENGSEEFIVRPSNSSYYDQSHLLGTLYAYQQFAILRPSFGA